MRTVRIKQGALQGIEKKTLFSDKTYYSFLNIPYAKPPIGNLRFQPPQPHDGWSGIHDATKFGNIAPQIKILPRQKFAGNEDCLYLHVYVPESLSENQSLKPVMVFIHGGAFNYGSCDPGMFGPDFLMEKDVILVTVNYRLSILGFLNLGLAECPGNMGLRDQALAFQWVKANIKEFGGDPNNVTAIGESAGAASVHYHMISPKGKGLFNRAILQSGNCLNIWAFSHATIEASLRLGHVLGFDTNDRPGLLRSLQTVPVNDLFNAISSVTKEMLESGVIKTFPFLPSKEVLDDKSMAYLPEEPQVLIQSASAVPTITGLSEKEGVIVLLTTSSKTLLNMCNDNCGVVPSNLKTFDQPLASVGSEIRRYYVGDRTVSENTYPDATDYFTDMCFTMVLYKMINHITEQPNCPVYLYNFTREDTINYRKTIFSTVVHGIEGTTHGDELGYIFVPHSLLGNIIPGDGYNEFTLKAVHDITSYWTNFARNGNPNGEDTEVEWLPHIADKPRYLRIGHAFEMKEGRLLNDRLQFWETLNEKISQKWYLKASRI